jgi:hypothetical protein
MRSSSNLDSPLRAWINMRLTVKVEGVLPIR